jgi:hypothetical protein
MAIRFTLALLSLWILWQTAGAGAGAPPSSQDPTQSTLVENECRGGIDPWGGCGAGS